MLRNEQSQSIIQTKILEHTERELNFRITTLEACDPSELFSDEIKQIIFKTMQELPEQTRRIFIESRKNAKTNREIAEELGISIKTVEFHVSKALKVFRVKLKDYLPFLALLIRIHF